MAYASTTEVSVAKTRAEIEGLLTKHKALAFGNYQDQDRAVIWFTLNDRQIRFTLPLPSHGDKQFKLDGRGNHRSAEKVMAAWEQACRSRWRALFLCIKAKLESVESRIESFDEAFLGQIVMADKQTVYERTKATIAEEYQLGHVTPLLMLGGPK